MPDGDFLVENEFVQQLHGARLLTAEILYRIPDHPHLLQTYIWQDLDKIPGFPALRKFLTFWQRELDGQLYSIRIAHTDHVTPGAWRNVGVDALLG